MSKNTIIISIENATCEEVKSVLLAEYGLNIQENKPCQLLGIHVDVQDLGYAYNYAREFLDKEGLQEEHPFYKEFEEF